MFTEKRQSGNGAVCDRNRFQLINLAHVGEADVLQNEFEWRIGESAAIVLRNNDASNLMPQLQQRLKHAVVLVIVSDQDIIDVGRQILVSVARYTVAMVIADDRVSQDIDIFRLDQNTSVTKITNPDRVAVVSCGRRRGVFCKELRELLMLCFAHL